MTSDGLPASGAWTPADPRRSAASSSRSPPSIRSPSRAARCSSDVTVAYETWGTLDADASNAILVCHAWTGDSHAAGRAGPGHNAPGWWNDVVGPGKYIDTDRWFVVCPNVLGGCQGSTGPASPHPADGLPYGSRFPVVTIRDMVRAQARLMRHLGIDQWASVIGGSMGGMQVLEWAITYRKHVRSIVPIATCMQASAQQIAWGVIGRRAIRLDPALAGWRLLRRRAGRRPGAGPGDRPPGRPGHVPQRQRLHRAIRPQPDRPFQGRRHVRPVAGVRGRALPPVPRRQARSTLRRQQLPDHRQGDGSPRRRPRPRQPGACDVA